MFPEGASPSQIERAKAVCVTCPLIRECARQALYAGTDLRQEAPAPAVDVIMGGVLCDGSDEALEALEAAAGMQGIYKGRKRALVAFGTPCRNCGTPMVRWSRYQPPIPEGFAMHRGRGLCENCRAVYAEEVAAWRAANPEAAARQCYGSKATDRKKTSLSALPGKIETALKNGDDALANELRFQWSLEIDREAVRTQLAKGREIVLLPHRGQKTNVAFVYLQRNPRASSHHVGEIVGCSPSVANSARAMLASAEVPGFEPRADGEVTGEEWTARVKHAKAELNRRAAKRRRRQALSLLRDRPDLSQNQISRIVGINRRTVRELARKHNIAIRPPGRPEPTAPPKHED